MSEKSAEDGITEIIREQFHKMFEQGSLEHDRANRERQEMIRNLSDSLAEDDLDEDEDELEAKPPGHGADGEWLSLLDGMVYVRKWNVEGLQWEKYYVDDMMETPAWRLNVILSDDSIKCITLHGEAAASIMRDFGLPEDPPQR
jgi:hypothetical protein